VRAGVTRPLTSRAGYPAAVCAGRVPGAFCWQVVGPGTRDGAALHVRTFETTFFEHVAGKNAVLRDPPLPTDCFQCRPLQRRR
jgi:hypothetical protein